MEYEFGLVLVPAPLLEGSGTVTPGVKVSVMVVRVVAVLLKEN